jgi:hypothetical protein
MVEQVGGLGSSWLHRGTLGEPRETWANIAFAMGLSCQSLL